MCRSLLFVLCVPFVVCAQPLPKLIPDEPAVIAHRGGEGPDSTIANLRRSLARGYVHLELDVRLSKDGKVLVIHDPTVDRTTNGKGNVGALTFDDLRKLDAGSKYQDPENPKLSFAGEKIPTPEEVLRFVGEKGIVLLELKVPEASTAVVESIQLTKAHARAVIRTADVATLKAIKKLDAKILTGTMGPLPEGKPEEIVKHYKDLGVSAVTPTDSSKLTKELIAQFHAAGIAVWATNTNDLEVMKRLLEMRVAGIITDRPADLQKLLKKK